MLDWLVSYIIAIIVLMPNSRYYLNISNHYCSLAVISVVGFFAGNKYIHTVPVFHEQRAMEYNIKIQLLFVHVRPQW